MKRKINFHFVPLPVDAVGIKPAELAVLTYICRHQLSFGNESVKLTDDEFLHGRHRKGGKRMDSGCGLKGRNSLKKARSALVKSGWITFEEAGDKARLKRYYKIRVSETDTQGVQNGHPECPKRTPGVSESDTRSHSKDSRKEKEEESIIIIGDDDISKRDSSRNGDRPGHSQTNPDVLENPTSGNTLFSRDPQTVPMEELQQFGRCPNCMSFMIPRLGNEERPFLGCIKYQLTGCKGRRVMPKVFSVASANTVEAKPVPVRIDKTPEEKLADENQRIDSMLRERCPANAVSRFGLRRVRERMEALGDRRTLAEIVATSAAGPAAFIAISRKLDGEGYWESVMVASEVTK